jgi:excisionase family DNA binding protein
MDNMVLSNLLDRKEAAKYLRICKTTLDKLDVSRIKIRRRVLFRRSDLDNWLNQNTQMKEVQK